MACRWLDPPGSSSLNETALAGDEADVWDPAKRSVPLAALNRAAITGARSTARNDVHGGATASVHADLHPHVRWWESMDVPRRSIQFVEVAELTLAALVCEDLAQNDDVAELIREVGPTIVLTALLDGPQLNSRWAARYASVLADDPGSAVMTLTSFGMVQRSRPRGREPSPVVAVWKNPSRGVREIPFEAGAHGVLLTLCTDRATRRTADGRTPIDNGTSCFDVAVRQIRASPAGSRSRAHPRPGQPRTHSSWKTSRFSLPGRKRSWRP